MTGPLPPEAVEVFDRGEFVHVAVRTPHGPHLTPMVFVRSGSRLWVTTSRSSVKARAWKADPEVAGLVRAGPMAVAFTGSVRTHDVLDARTWPGTAFAAPAVARAAFAFSRKNARFFAGYAVDAYRVPLAWTPPGRVFAEIRPERVALLDAPGGRVLRAWGEFPDRVGSRREFRVSRATHHPLDGIPGDVLARLAERGEAALALDGPAGLAAIPARWWIEGRTIATATTKSALELTGAGPEAPGAVTIDRASTWRARHMTGLLVQGRGEVFVPGRVRSGRTGLEARLRDLRLDPASAAVVRLRPERLVWWRGWQSGTVATR